MIAFSLGSLDIYRYGIFYFLAFLAGYAFLYRISKKNIFGKSFPHLQTFLEKHVDDLMIFIFLGVLLGGRLGHVIIYNFSYYMQHPGEIFQVRKGGMSFIGGMVGVALAFTALARKKKFRFKEVVLLFDLVLVMVPFGIMLGRIGNFLNQELYGLLVPEKVRGLGASLVTFLTKIQIFHIYPLVGPELRINTNFLSSFFEGLVLFVLLFSIVRTRVKSKKVQPGKIVAIFLIGYSFVRFLLEYVRADSQLEFYGRFSISQRFFLIFFIVGRGVRVWSHKQKKT